MIRAGELLGALAVLVGAVVLVGWVLDIPILKSLRPGFVSMKVNAAVALALMGLVTILLAPRDRSPARERVGRVLAWAVALVGVLTLIEYASGADLRIDTLLFSDPDAPLTGSPGRMSPLSAMGFTLLGSAFGLLDIPRFRRTPFTLGLVTVAVLLTALAGYLYGANQFIGASRLTTGIAVHTLLGLALLVAALFLIRAPESGLAAAAFGTGPADTLVRRLLPAVILVPLGLGYLIVLSGPSQEVRLMLSFFVVGSTLASGILLGLTARAVARSDVERSAAITELEAAQTELEARVSARTSELDAARRDLERELARATKNAQIVESIDDAVFSVDGEGIIQTWNRGAEEVYGYTAEEVLGSPVSILVPPQDSASSSGLVRRVRSGERVVNVRLPRRRKDGARIIVLATVSPLRTADGKVTGLAMVSRDITSSTAQHLGAGPRASGADAAREAIRGLAPFLTPRGIRVDAGELPELELPPDELVSLFTDVIQATVDLSTVASPHVTIIATERTSDWLFSVGDDSVGHDADALPADVPRGYALQKARTMIERRGGKFLPERWSEGRVLLQFTLPAAAAQTAGSKS